MVDKTIGIDYLQLIIDYWPAFARLRHGELLTIEGKSDRSGVLYGNHIDIIGRKGNGNMRKIGTHPIF